MDSVTASKVLATILGLLCWGFPILALLMIVAGFLKKKN